MTTCVTMDRAASHAWGGVHERAWQKEGQYEQSVMVNGNSYAASNNFERSDDWHASSGTGAQHFDYLFQVHSASVADPFSESGHSGQVVTLTFPTPVEIKAVYGGFGATLDVASLPRSFGHTGASAVQILWLCSGGNRYTGECPATVSGAGAQASQQRLNLQGLRNTPLHADESQTSIMPVIMPELTQRALHAPPY